MTNITKPGSFIALDGKNFIPLNTEGFTEEDWKFAIYSANILCEARCAAKIRNMKIVLILLSMVAGGMACFLGGDYICGFVDSIAMGKK